MSDHIILGTKKRTPACRSATPRAIRATDVGRDGLRGSSSSTCLRPTRIRRPPRSHDLSKDEPT